MAKTWGTDGLLLSSRLYDTGTSTDLAHLVYRHDANGNIGAITDQLDDANSVLFGYDEMDRLTMAVSASAGTPASYSYTTGTNQLASVTDGSGTRNIAYDDRGNTDTETRPGSITLSTAYDGYGRLSTYDRSDLGDPAEFIYNGLDDRVTMLLPTAGTRHFVYDSAGRVMGEYGASATDVQAEFIWLMPEVGPADTFGGDDGLGGYMPLAVATPDSSSAIQLNWIHADHLGTPILATDSSGDPASTPDDYLAAAFPGQSRMFGDLYYNRYRDYDPTTGRYIQGDPIGLGGGDNPYLYADANPVNGIDPLGLKKVNWFDPVIDKQPFEGAENTPDINGVCMVFSHGSTGSVNKMSKVEDIRKALLQAGCKPKEPVYFFGCDTGKTVSDYGDKIVPIAEQFSIAYKIKTRAPNEWVWWISKGIQQIARPYKVPLFHKNFKKPDPNHKGDWIFFEP